MRTLIICTALALGAATSASAADVVSRPDWLSRPRPEDLADVFPVKALRQGISGRGVIQCQITALGVLDACTVVSETPPGMGFGEATLALAPRFLMRPKMVNGVAVAGGTVQIPISFKTQGAAPVGSTIRVARIVPWAQTPTAAQMAEAFPKVAVGKADAGHVVVRCKIQNSGALSGCEVVSSQPDGAGFGPAALKVSRFFRVKMGDNPNLPSDLRVDVPIDFRSPDKPATVIHSPEWTRTVTPEYSATLFPEKAAAAGLVSGRGVVDCEVDPTGALTACKLVREEPAGLGFGEAAVKIAGMMAMNPWTSEGFPVGGLHYQFAVRLDRPDEAPKPAAP